MPMTRIDETRKFFIEEYGEPIEKVVDGKKYRYVNSPLESFDKLIKMLKESARILNINLKEEHINAFCDFALTEVHPNVLNVATKLEKYVKSWENKGSLGKKPVVNLLNELEEYYNDEKYKPRCLMGIFVKHIKCADVYRKQHFTTILQ